MEQVMAYIVVYQREDGSSGIEECADIDLAIVTAERLRNVDSIERPRILKTQEITYDFKPYYRVEVNEGGSQDDATTPAAAVAASDLPAPPASAATVESTLGVPVPESTVAPAPELEPEPVVAEEHSADEADEMVQAVASHEEAAEMAVDPLEPVEVPGAEATIEDLVEEVPEDMAEQAETATVTTSGGLFGDREAIAERLGDFPLTGADEDSGKRSRRGLFGR